MSLEGANRVGFASLRLNDSARTDWDGAGPRPLASTIWYPAPADAPGVTLAVPPDNPGMVLGDLAVGADVHAPRPLPVVLLSHGTGGSAVSLGWLAGHLASHGFAVIGVDHHGNTASEPYRAEGFLAWWERARHLSVALDQLSTQGPLAGRLDLDRVTAAGFSLGGYAVMALAGAVTDMRLFQAWMEQQPGPVAPPEFPDLTDRLPGLLDTDGPFRRSWERHGDSYGDPRVRRVLSLAPAPTIRGFTLESLKAIKLPVSIAVGEADTETPLDNCAGWPHDQIPHGTLRVLRPGYGHYQFVGLGTALAQAMEPTVFADPPGVDRRVMQAEVCELAADFLSAV